MSELAVGLETLDANSKKEMMQWLEAERSKSKVQSAIHNFTDMCFKKCIFKIDSGELSSNEESCLNGCLNRFLDTNIKIVKGLQSIQK
ncbi:protein transporter TIM8 ASCRUDRAFT_94404 [Ascoidea rubescens DSM 1968]|uniref:Mitochondrial import inner membrane translocase subunit n=1 Tax=Ascoidea rubescens DSM 1968 TaxID=1344418 RepID=A0A1D2VNX3_9ASCO|nr:hypothetical protein ASCRUDRAFT_94404 [Ascoidea rubescens DSM 1968]ODV63322.1 hypothetical protein ASCRUDRAFT_94404 [Ascoidea rubescens DSM 1968]